MRANNNVCRQGNAGNPILNNHLLGSHPRNDDSMSCAVADPAGTTNGILP